MFNEKESRCSTLTNRTNLSIQPNKDDRISSRRAATACERFLLSSALLHEGESLGWQINMETLSNVVFSTPGVKVTNEDFNWIFHQCAIVSPSSADWMEDLYTDNRIVYMLSSANGGTRDIEVPKRRVYCIPEENYDKLPPRDLFNDLFDMMAETGTVIRIIADSTSTETKGHGRIFLSLPSELTLRMRGTLSLAFPHMVANQVVCRGDDLSELEYLPDDLFLESMSSIWTVLLCRTAVKGCFDEYILADNYEINTSDEEEKDCTPIDDLSLSVRSANCLRRAGICTVGELRALSDYDLMQIRNLGRKCIEEIKQKLSDIHTLPKAIPLQTTDYMAMLDALIGLADVKEQVRKIVAYAKMKREMSGSGNTNRSVTLNMEFVGNPGTAKTTVARIIAGIFYEIGLLSSSEPIEVGRADLVAKYEGQTASKVKDVFQKAKGKLLLIDEAYSLVGNLGDEFGDEAINTIVQEMENNRENIIVIFAGYPDRMEHFFFRNPGLRSRVPFHIRFCDYSGSEMVKIAELEAKKWGFSIGAEAYEKLTIICSEASKRADFGNGRFCRNLVENAILAYASRIYENDGVDSTKKWILASEDFTPPNSINNAKRIPIGFHVE